MIDASSAGDYPSFLAARKKEVNRLVRLSTASVFTHGTVYQREMFPFERFHAWNGGGKFTVYSNRGKK